MPRLLDALISGWKRSVWKLFDSPCMNAAMRSSPAPVSTDGLGSGTSVPSGCWSNCMKTRFQNSRNRPASAPSTNASFEKSLRSISVHSPFAPAGNVKSRRDVREVDEDLAARTARTGVRHLPEIVVCAEAIDPGVGQTRDLAPQLARFVVILEDGDARDAPAASFSSLVTNSHANRIASRLK